MKRTLNKIKALLVVAGLLTVGLSATAQDNIGENRTAPIRIGLLGGVNYNSVGVGGAVSDSLALPGTSANLSDAQGWGPYAGLMFEYNPDPGSLLGVQARFTYDDRSVDFEAGEGDAQQKVDVKAAYLSFEPGLRFNFGSPNALHLVLGPSLNVLANSDVEQEGQTAASVSAQAIEGAFKDVTFGVWGGFGWDMPLGDLSPNGTMWILTPFVEGSWLADQVKIEGAGTDNVDDNWSTVTVRAGLQLKYGFGGPTNIVAPPPPPTPSAGAITMDLRTPVGGVTESRSMQEFLPLLNYMFFPEGQAAVPAKYEQISAGDAASFETENMVTRPVPTAGAAANATRSQRQLEVYYNVMNVVGDRLNENPTAKLTLVGAAADVNRAKTMADNVKNYLVSTFGIDAARIDTKGQQRPPHASGTRATPKEDLDLVAEENIRVELLSDNPEIIKPVQLNVQTEEPIENDIVVSVQSTEPLSSWSVEITGNGFSEEYGPFYTSPSSEMSGTARINATPILGSRANATYTARVTARTEDDETLTSTETFQLAKRTLPPVTGTRYSILFDYDEARTVKTYDTFLRNEVAPRIPDGSTVFIHGHTDVAGLEDYNMKLSAKRASEAQSILADALKKLGRSATFDSYGFGETTFRAPFGNETPEGRYYNRTVMIEIIPES